MKTGKTLKLAGALAASLALLAVLAGCGQSSKPSSQKDSTSGTSAKSASQSSTHPSSSSPLPSTSTSTASSSPTSASASNTLSSSTASSTPAASSSSADSTGASTQQMPSDEVLYLLAYIKYRGGLEAITPSDLIVDEYMIGTQKGTVLTMAPVAPIPFKLGLKGKEVQMLGDEEENEVYRSYNIENLIGEYYATPSQQSEVNSLLQEGERHNVLDILALMASPAWVSGESNSSFFISNNYLAAKNGGGQVIVKGNEVELGATIGLEAAEATGARMHYHCYYFNAQSLLDKYYSTPAQKAQVNEYIGLGTQNGIPSWQQGFPS